MRSLAVFLSFSICATSATAQQDATGKYSQPAQHSNTPNQSSQVTASPAQSASVQNQTVSAAPTGFVLLDGTPVKLRINRTVSSADAHVGDTVDFEVLEEVPVSGTVVVPKGGTAFATVTEAQAKRRMARGGKLDINIDYVRLVDEEKAALRAGERACVLRSGCRYSENWSRSSTGNSSCLVPVVDAQAYPLFSSFDKS